MASYQTPHLALASNIIYIDSQFDAVVIRSMPQADACHRSMDQGTTLITPFCTSILSRSDKGATRVVWNQTTSDYSRSYTIWKQIYFSTNRMTHLLPVLLSLMISQCCNNSICDVTMGNTLGYPYQTRKQLCWCYQVLTTWIIQTLCNWNLLRRNLEHVSNKTAHSKLEIWWQCHKPKMLAITRYHALVYLHVLQIWYIA